MTTNEPLCNDAAKEAPAFLPNLFAAPLDLRQEHLYIVRAFQLHNRETP